MDRVSIVTICLNEEKNIKQTLESVLEQTYTNIEYIIKDGESTDRTNEIIKQTLENYNGKEIKYIIQKDTGIYDAMNQAIDFCTGDWVIFINSGDSLSNNIIIERIFGNKDYTNVDVLYGDVFMCDAQEECIWEADITKLPYKMPFSHQGCLIRTNLVKDEKFDTNYKIAADFEMILNFYIRNCRFLYTNQIISVFKLNGISSTNFFNKEKEHYRVLKIHGITNLTITLKYYVSLCIACIKNFIEKKFPCNIKAYLKTIYKFKMKQYCTKEEYYEKRCKE